MNKEPYSDWCEECEAPMVRISKDKLQIFCDICWVPKPIPLVYLNTHAKLEEVKRLAALAACREADLA